MEEVKETKVEIDDKEKSLMQCTSNFEDHSFYNVEEDHCDVVDDGSGNKEVKEEEVDVLGFGDKNDEIEALECNDGTDYDMYSSSFSGTVSEDENETSLNDQEVDSMVCNDNDTSLPFLVRKKKLTDHWRRFIQPIMWRCKWIELKIKEVQNQAQMYDKELEETCEAKRLELESIKSEEVGIKAMPPLPCHSQKTQLKKRKKRNRVEETSDVASYTSNHNLLSYSEHRKSFADIALSDNSRNLDKRNKSTKDETVFSDETPLLEFREGDAFLEQILLKIEAAKLEARNLKNRVDKVVNENPTRFSSVNTVNILGSADAFTSSEQQNPLLVIKNEDERPIISEEKPVKSASVSSHHDEATPEDDEAPDILLSDILASRQRAGKAIVPDKKQQKTEQTPVEEGSSRPARKRKPRNLDVVTNEETKPKRRRVSREKPKSNAMASRFKRKRGKRRTSSAGLRRRS